MNALMTLATKTGASGEGDWKSLQGPVLERSHLGYDSGFVQQIMIAVLL